MYSFSFESRFYFAKKSYEMKSYSADGPIQPKIDVRFYYISEKTKTTVVQFRERGEGLVCVLAFNLGDDGNRLVRFFKYGQIDSIGISKKYLRS